MAQFLEVSVGDFSFLLSSAEVREIWWDDVGTGAGAEWRRSDYPRLDCHDLLGLPPAAAPTRTLIAYGAADRPVVLAVDRVVALHRVAEQAVVPLPVHLSPLNRFFAGACLLDDGRPPMLCWSRQEYDVRGDDVQNA